MRRGVVVVLAGITACSSPADAPPVERHLPTPAERAAAPKSSAEGLFGDPSPSPGAPPGSGSAAAPPTGPRRATQSVQWSDVRTEPGCFYFSGPDGRDDQLTGAVRVEREGDRVTLRIGDAIFVGSYQHGELLAERRSEHDFHGRWRVTETLRGRYLERQMRARYHYSECPTDAPCPGPCTIDATLTFVR